MLKKILVANRGEIAVRVMRACHELKIPCAAVYSEADREALFVKYADEAYCIGPAPASRSYLNIEKVVRTALECGADANVKDNIQGDTALMMASLFGYTDIAKLLLEAGADVNVKNDFGWTAMWWAKKSGHKEVVKLLKRYGAKG